MLLLVLGAIVASCITYDYGFNSAWNIIEENRSNAAQAQASYTEGERLRCLARADSAFQATWRGACLKYHDQRYADCLKDPADPSCVFGPTPEDCDSLPFAVSTAIKDEYRKDEASCLTRYPVGN